MNDRFLIGSITKSVFATAVLQQVAAGRLRLSDTVAHLDPALARKYPIASQKTVRQLLGMTSRIPDYADPAVARMFANSQQGFTRDQAITLGIAEGKPIPAPGGYSTTNYLLLGKLMAKITGSTPEQLVNSVFTRSGMTSSRLMQGNVQMPEPKAHGYLGAVYGPQAAQVNPSLSGTTDVTDWAMEWGKEGGGAYATIADLASWGQTCLGILRQGDWLTHSGQALGYTANVACNPKTGAVIAYALNSTEGPLDLSSGFGLTAWPDYGKAEAS